MTRCIELLDRPRLHSPHKPEIGDLWRCNAPTGPPVTLPCPAGRPDAVAGPYCTAHGGHARADAEARRDWSFLAPASVGHEGKVLETGCLGLTSPNAYLVIRQEMRGMAPERWRIRSTVEFRRSIEAANESGPTMQRYLLGSGSRDCATELEAQWRALRAVIWSRGGAGDIWCLARYQAGEPLPEEPLPDGITIERLPASAGRPVWTAALGIGSLTETLGQFETAEEAERTGRLAWRKRLDRDVAEITAARGGTLDWGVPIEPRTEPIVLRPAVGISAWDEVARSREPRAPADLGSMISGVRRDGSPA